MTKFTTFKCTVCDKTRDFIKDSMRVLPNNCNITPNCTGRLYPLEDKSFSQNYYTLSSESPAPEEASEDDTFYLNNSAVPIINIAVKSTASLPDILHLNLLMQKIDSIGYKQYSFKLSQASSTVPELINGVPKKDINGKNLTFTASDIASKKISITINGVPALVGVEISEISPGLITFAAPLPPGSMVTVIVYDEQKIKSEKLIFTKNTFRKITYGSWSNISKVKSRQLLESSEPAELDVYHCDDFQTLKGNYKILIESVTDENDAIIKSALQLNEVLFLLSRYPHTTVDRYMNFVCKGSNFSKTYSLNSSYITIFGLSASREFLDEIYPPLIIEPTYIIEDLATLIDENREIDDISTQNIFKSSKII